MENYTAILYGKGCNTERQGKSVRLENLYTCKPCYFNSRLYIGIYLDRIIKYESKKDIFEYHTGAIFCINSSGIFKYRLL